MNRKKKNIQIYDYAVIGAGISGLYFAYQLLESNKSVIILEKMNRIGGRVDSVPIPNFDYVAEGCALRYRDDHTKLISLLKTFDIEGIRFESTTEEDPFISKMIETYPASTSQDGLDAIVNTPSIEQGSYLNLVNLPTITGYTFPTYTMNTQALYGSIAATGATVQYFVKGGFKSLFEKMAEKIKEKYEIVLRFPIASIIKKGDLYHINGAKYFARNIIWTGNRSELYILNTNDKEVRHKKKLLNKYIGTETIYMTIYLYLTNPWWSDETDVLKNIKSIGPLNSLFYMHRPVIRLYLDMKNAELLYSLVPQKHRFRYNMKWYQMVEAERLYTFLRKYIREMTGNTPDITHYTYKFIKEASVKLGQFEESFTPEEFYNQLQNDGTFNLISGDYGPRSGWIEGCLEVVDGFLKSKNLI